MSPQSGDPSRSEPGRSEVAFASGQPLRVLAVDDEAPALADLVFELRTFPAIGEVMEASDATAALRALRDSTVDAVFMDIQMPGLSGLELARVLQQFKSPPALVFVTAHDEHAVEAFDVSALDYVLKPVRRERLERAIERVIAAKANLVEVSGRVGESDTAATGVSPYTVQLAPGTPTAPPRGAGEDRTLSVETGGRIRFIDRRDVCYVAASGDYVRLHMRDTSYLYRTALSALEDRWGPLGFVRIHRSYLVALAHIEEVRIEPGKGYVIRIGDKVLPVSRRLATNLRSRLYAYASEQARP